MVRAGGVHADVVSKWVLLTFAAGKLLMHGAEQTYNSASTEEAFCCVSTIEIPVPRDLTLSISFAAFVKRGGAF